MSDKEVLAVMSKVKAYVKAKGMNTAASVSEALSDKIRAILDSAVAAAAAAKRKTVMDKDI